MHDLFPAGYVVRAGAGLAGDPGLKASHHSTAGALTVLETSIGADPPLHVHDHEKECFYVLDGEMTVRFPLGHWGCHSYRIDPRLTVRRAHQ